ncbi:phage head morphogenesis protein [Pseudomonas protegens]|uniref:phage head morphogenesis protein n=1 Tax=Pseudomonas protegens TaxID=380021 RepID=UPI001F17EAD4|nr:phage head morphogenesis protein [Pseudomonas protegens]
MNAAEILRAIEALEPGMQRAYLDSIRAAVDAAVIAEVERLIAEDDEQGLVALLSLGALAAFAEALRGAFLAGGRFEMTAIILPAPLRREIGRKEFDPSTDPAQARIAQQVQQIRQISVDGVRDAVRAVMGSRRVVGGPWVPSPGGGPGQAGTVSPPQPARGARQAALDLVGRVSPQTGQRTGGVLGLPGNMAQYVVNTRQQLLSGDPSEMRKYFARTRRDRRFDGIVRRAIESGQPVSAADVEKIAGRYSERLLKTHVDMLAKTAAAESFNAGRDQAWEQLVAQGIDRNKVTKEWRDRADEKVRNSHRHMRGQTVILGQAFRTGSGALLRYPGDSSLGAGYDEIANCRCFIIYSLRK